MSADTSAARLQPAPQPEHQGPAAPKGDTDYLLWEAALDAIADLAPKLKGEAELPELFFGRCLGSVCGGFLESNCVHAISQAAGRRTVREYVAEMCVTGIADGFYALQEGGSVKAVCNYIERHWLGE